MCRRTINLLKTLILIVFVSVGCSGNELNKDDSYIIYQRSYQKTKDSLFLLFAVNKCIERNFEYFDNFKYFEIPLDEVTFWVNNIYYSPDSLKLIATIIDREPNNKVCQSTNSDSSFYYDGFALIGYRNTIDSPLVTYRFQYFTMHCWDSYIQVERLQRNQLEEKLKNLGTFVWNDSVGNWEGVKFQYNIKDNLFWTNSIIWKEGLIIPGFYTFEVKRVVSSGDTTKGLPRRDGINLEYK